MTTKTEEITQLFKDGKTTTEIHELTGYCFNTIRGVKKRMSDSPIYRKIERFQKIVKPAKPKKQRVVSKRRSISLRIHTFCQNLTRRNQAIGSFNKASFTVEDVINKFGEKPICYLTGDILDFYDPESYQFDHIIPRSKNGPSTIDNLGIASRDVNMAKNDLSVNEFIALCKKVLEHNGYTVNK